MLSSGCSIATAPVAIPVQDKVARSAKLPTGSTNWTSCVTKKRENMKMGRRPVEKY